MAHDCLPLDLPDWAIEVEASTDTVISDDEAGMRFVISLARQNVVQGTGGPFGAAIFSQQEGRLLAIGVNSVMRLNSSVMHAEMLAILRAQKRLGNYTLRTPGFVLYSSCEPCAMCLGGILWSGLRRLVCGADAASARAIGFDEGPVYAESYQHLTQAGIAVRRNVLASEARSVIDLYKKLGGTIYNG
jgi:tRNA(Arg) A34 adenosine deaminase TadA